MKKVAFIYRNRENQEVITYLENTLYHIFEGYIEIRSYFIDELLPNEQIEADAYLLVYEDMKHKKRILTSYA